MSAFDRRIAKLESVIGFDDWRKWIGKPYARWPDSAIDARIREIRLTLYGIPEAEEIDRDHLFALMKADAR
jgi:hypothetical protein